MGLQKHFFVMFFFILTHCKRIFYIPHDTFWVTKTPHLLSATASLTNFRTYCGHVYLCCWIDLQQLSPSRVSNLDQQQKLVNLVWFLNQKKKWPFWGHKEASSLSSDLETAVSVCGQDTLVGFSKLLEGD